MEAKGQLSPDVIYELVADVGFRRHFHLGGMEATRELLELCHLSEDQYVLDVGCGSGKTACYIARRYGCSVVGIDVLERMIDRANERAQREGVQGVRFRAADAQDLPFEEDLFDVVLGEFITGLLDDKRRAVSEYVRVVKPGGYVGLNEATWVKTPPPTELAEYLRHTFGVAGEMLSSDDWAELLKGAGLRDVVVRAREVDALGSKMEGLKDVLTVWHRVLYLYVRSPAFRRFIKETLSVPENLLEYFGYGIYVGRK